MSFNIIVPPPQKLRNPSGINPEDAVLALLRHKNSVVSSSMLLIANGGFVEDFIGGRRNVVWRKRYSYVEADINYIRDIVRMLNKQGVDFIIIADFLDSSSTVIYADDEPYVIVAAVKPLFVTDSKARFFVTVGDNGVFYSRDGWFVRGSGGDIRLGDLVVGSWYIVFIHVFFDPETSEFKMDVFLMDNGFDILGIATGVVVDRYDSSMFLFDFDDVTLDIVGSIGIDWIIAVGYVSGGGTPLPG